MSGSLYEWLGDIEDSLTRMIRGVFRFIIDGFPKWVYHMVVETIGPVALRLGRVLVLLCLWLVVLFCPMAGTFMLGLPSWCGFGSTIWLGMAIVGSFWGLNHLTRERKAVLALVRSGDELPLTFEQDRSSDSHTGNLARRVCISVRAAMLHFVGTSD